MMSAIVLTFAATPLSEPAAINPLLSASNWLESTLLGTFATAIAVIAVAAQGLMLLTGRLQARRGMALLAGCFLVFGASTIANGIRSVLGDGDRSGKVAAVARAPEPLPSMMVTAPPLPTRTSRPYDPYAGAAVPSHN